MGTTWFCLDCVRAGGLGGHAAWPRSACLVEKADEWCVGGAHAHVLLGWEGVVEGCRWAERGAQQVVPFPIAACMALRARWVRGAHAWVRPVTPQCRASRRMRPQCAPTSQPTLPSLHAHMSLTAQRVVAQEQVNEAPPRHRLSPASRYGPPQPVALQVPAQGAAADRDDSPARGL